MPSRKEPRVVDGVVLWRCPACERWLVAGLFFKRARRSNGLTSHCRKCHGEGQMRTRDAEKNRIASRESAQRARLRDPEKVRARERLAASVREVSQKTLARDELNRAVAAGRIARPSVCEKCGRARKVHGHHTDYAQPLLVTWLCTLCHGFVDRKEAA